MSENQIEYVEKELIVELIELRQLLVLCPNDNERISNKKSQLISTIKDYKLLKEEGGEEIVNYINSIINFDEEECNSFIEKNLWEHFWNKKLK